MCIEKSDIGKLYYNKHVNKQLDGTKGFYWDRGEECHRRKVAFRLVLEDLTSRDRHSTGREWCGKDTEEGKWSELNRTGSCPVGQNRECG